MSCEGGKSDLRARRGLVRTEKKGKWSGPKKKAGKWTYWNGTGLGGEGLVSKRKEKSENSLVEEGMPALCHSHACLGQSPLRLAALADKYYYIITQSAPSSLIFLTSFYDVPTSQFTHFVHELASSTLQSLLGTASPNPCPRTFTNLFHTNVYLVFFFFFFQGSRYISTFYYLSALKSVQHL